MPKILGINPGTRYVGIALLDGPELKDWGVKVIKGRWSKEKLEKATSIVSGMMQRFEADVLAIKRLHPSRSSANLKLLVAKLKELARRRGLKVYQYSTGEVEGFFCPDQRTSKKDMAEVISSKFPALLHDFNKERAHKNPYHLRMFEAVALASICFHRLDKA